VAGVARPPHTRVGESISGQGEAPARFSHSALVFSFRQMVCYDAATLRRRALHGGDLVGVLASAPLFLLRSWTPSVVR
jgi:hypothetical protein